jgi:predicted nuclease of predicted toxin-antitoxin system
LRFKLDENLGRLARELLEAAGHDVETVHGEGLCTASDDRVIQVARQEHRCLVTLDLEFGNPLRYRAADYAGIAILRLPDKPSLVHLQNALRTLIKGLEPKIAATSG